MTHFGFDLFVKPFIFTIPCVATLQTFDRSFFVQPSNAVAETMEEINTISGALVHSTPKSWSGKKLHFPVRRDNDKNMNLHFI